jgi:hypothetical protein
MTAKLKNPSRKMGTVLTGGMLAALAIPGANAQAATTPGPPGPHPGLADPAARPAVPRGKLTGNPKVATPDSSCGGNDITWQDRNDERYLEIYHSGTANGNWADAFPGNGTCTQHWFAVVSGSLSNGLGFDYAVYGMVNTNSDKCLAAPTSNVGNAHVVQESCGFSHYNYRWAEESDHTGWLLLEAIAPGYRNGFGWVSGGIIACEDTQNHWIFTSYDYVAATGRDNFGAKNCIWH